VIATSRKKMEKVEVRREKVSQVGQKGWNQGTCENTRVGATLRPYNGKKKKEGEKGKVSTQTGRVGTGTLLESG